LLKKKEGIRQVSVVSEAQIAVAIVLVHFPALPSCVEQAITPEQYVVLVPLVNATTGLYIIAFTAMHQCGAD
jgi:hypothetical protein